MKIRSTWINTNKGNYNEQIKLEALDLEEGMSKRVVCVFCGGGKSKEKSLSLTRVDGGVVFKCFRDKCQSKGVALSKGAMLSGHTPTSKLKPKTNEYKGSTTKLDEAATDYLSSKFLLTSEDLSPLRQTEEGDILFPLKDCYGRPYGHIDRRYVALNGIERVPKAINRYSNRDVPNLHFPLPISKQVTSLVLVEDWLSAQRVSKHLPCASLLGTNLDKQSAVHLRQLGIDTVVFFLDADANKTAKSLVHQHSLMFPNIHAVIRDVDAPDPKDMDEESLTYWCNHIVNIAGIE